MQSTKVLLPEERWGSLHTKHPARSQFVNSDEFTSGSKNFDVTVKGVITKRLGSVDFIDITDSAKDQYEAIFSDGVHHLLTVSAGNLRFSSGSSPTLVTAGYSAIGNFEFALYADRVYFGNGIDPNQVYDRASTYGGVVYTAPKTKQMGALAPLTAPTTADGGAGAIAAGTYRHKVTFVYYDDLLEESNGGPASTPLVLAANRQISLTSVPIGGYGVVARKIYREVSTSPDVFELVGTINNNTATVFTDNNATPTALIPDDNNVPEKFKYIVQHKDVIWIAGLESNSSDFRFSLAGQPDIFPDFNFVVGEQGDSVTGMVVYNDRILVFNRNSFGQILGSSPDTYRFSRIPGSIGCVDNRSIQIRTLRGVPVVIWLSDKGFYAFNGSSVEYISEAIEDLVNLNIQQAAAVKGQDIDTDAADFNAGTLSSSVSTGLVSGDVTQANPTKTWDEQAEWEEAGAVLTDLASRSGNDDIKAVVRYAPGYDSDGTHTGTQESTGNLVLPVETDFTGETYTTSSTRTILAASFARSLANKFTVPKSGTMNTFSIPLHVYRDSAGAPTTTSIVLQFYNDDGGGANPGTPRGVSYTISGLSVPLLGDNTLNLTFTGLGMTLFSGTNYWVDVRMSNPTNDFFILMAEFSNTAADTRALYVGGGPLDWSTIFDLNIGPAPINFRLTSSYTFTQFAIPNSGQWVSDTYDTASTTVSPATIEHTGSFPGTFGSTTSSITYVEGSTDGITFDVSQAFNNLNGSTAVSLADRRYWRIRISLASTDNRVTPTLGAVILKFPTTATWVSAPIDHTTDITALNSLTASSSIPSGTSVTLEIATSANNITYSSFTSIGMATPLRYSKVRITITTNAANDTTAVVTSATLNWTVVGSIASAPIDTINTPSGWDIFQASFTNGVTFEIRSGATLVALAAASYTAVTNNTFPTIATAQFVQWKATLTSTANVIAALSSVQVNWFINTTSSIRSASVFYNRSYYCSAAEFGESVNNIIFVFDENGYWHIYRGLSANTLSYFFNEPYFGSGLTTKIVRFLQGPTDNTVAIEMDIRTKAFDFGDPTVRKALRKIFIVGKNTGATYTATYSTDGGTTFKTLLTDAGTPTFTTTSDGSIFTQRVVPQSADDLQGRELLLRLYNNDTSMCEIHEIVIDAYIRKGEILV